MVWTFSVLICLSAWAAEKHSVQELTTLADSHDSGLSGAIAATFDLRPAGIIRALELRRPIFQQTASYGHFGRPDIDLTWERTDKAAELRAAAGLEPAAEQPAGV